jgi:hypothetical protein
MSSIVSFRENTGHAHRADAEVLKDYRQRLADEEFERAERKRLQAADQRSDFNDAKARIRAWEKLHELRLPTSATHPVLRVIAAATALTLDEVREEQRQRSTPLVKAAV